MYVLEPFVSFLVTTASFRVALAADPEAALATRGLALTDAERELVARLRPLLALAAEALLQCLLDGPDGDPPWQWDSYPSLAGYLG